MKRTALAIFSLVCITLPFWGYAADDVALAPDPAPVVEQAQVVLTPIDSDSGLPEESSNRDLSVSVPISDQSLAPEASVESMDSPSVDSPTTNSRKVWVCHRAGNKPLEVIYVDWNAWETGHQDHDEDFILSGPHDPLCVPIDPNPSNRPPVIAPLLPATLYAGELYEVTLSVTDPDNDPVTVTASGTPATATFTPATKTFSWTPFARDLGSHDIIFTATDPKGGVATATLALVVELRTPQCSFSGLFGTYYNLPKTHPDVEGPITGVISGTDPTTKDWYSQQYLSFTRNDALSVLNQSSGFFPVNEGLPKDPFYFASVWRGSVIVPEHGTYVAKLGSDDDSWLYINGQHIMDLGGVHAYQTTSTTVVLPKGTSTVEVYFAERHTVQSGILFRLDESHGSQPVVFSPCVPSGSPVNRPPVITGPAYASTTVSSTLTFTVTTSDPDGDPVSVSSTLPAGATYATSTGLFSWTPPTIGTSTATFTASDGRATSTLSVAIEVFASSGGGPGGNQAPIITGPSYASTTVSSTLTFAVAASDPNNDPITLTTELPTGATYATSTGIFSWTPTSTGTSTATFVAFDGSATSTLVVSLEVFPVDDSGGSGNHVPQIAPIPSPQYATATVAYAYDVDATDSDGDTLEFALSVFPEGMMISTSTGAISWMPSSTQATTTPYTVTVSVSDGTAVATTTFAVVVRNAPDTGTPGDTGGPGNTGGTPPGVNISVPQGGGGGGGGGQLLSGGVTGNRPPVFVNFLPPTSTTGTLLYLYDADATDPDGDTLTYSLGEAPRGMSILSTNGLIYWFPTEDQATAGPYAVTVLVSDGATTTRAVYTLVVNRLANRTAPSELNTVGVEPPLATLSAPSRVANLRVTATTSLLSEPSPAAETSTTAGNRRFGAALLAGLFNAFSGVIAWLKANWCAFSFPLWLITLALLIWALFRSRKDEDSTRVPEQDVDHTAFAAAIQAPVNDRLEKEEHSSTVVQN